jgi:hypothetical protein
MHLAKTRGLPAALGAAAFYAARRARRLSPVPWARLGAASSGLARLLPTRQPAVLVLSLPRSESSWVGATLGRGIDALYLREPMTQAMVQARGPGDPLLKVDPGAPPAAYARYAHRAFLGPPDFNADIVRMPGQWSLGQRGWRRLVIKEVNPYCCKWLLGKYQPRLIFLLRHPAAIAHSYHRLGWLRDDQQSWQNLGAHLGAALRAAYDSLPDASQCQVVSYEALCRNPQAGFRSMYEFAGLTWSTQVKDFVAETTASGDPNVPHTTQRRSAEMVHAWRSPLTGEQVGALPAGHAASGLPRYPTRDW